MDSKSPDYNAETGTLDTEIASIVSSLNRYIGQKNELEEQDAVHPVGHKLPQHQEQIRTAVRKIAELQGELESLMAQKLEQLLDSANLQSKDLNRLYALSLPETFAKLQSSTSSPQDAVDFLYWNIRDQDDRAVPVIEFAERLIKHVADPEIKKQLRTWINGMVNNGVLELRPQDRADAKKRIDDSEKPQHTYLLVEVTPANDQSEFSLRTYLWRSGNGFEPQRPRGSNPSDDYYATYKFDDLLRRVADLVDEEFDPNIDKIDTIEFMLPITLLDKEVDQATFPVGDGIVRKFCMRHTIVVRSLERSRPRPQSEWPRATNNWKRTWRKFLDPSAEEAPEVTWLCDPDGSASLEYYQRLANDFAVHVNRAICVGLTFVPTTEADPQAPGSLLRQLLLMGVPIMVWSRKHHRPNNNFAQIKQEMETIVCVENLRKLPQIIHGLRVCDDANSRADHMGNHLTLFWDDPDRIPPLPNSDHSRLIGEL